MFALAGRLVFGAVAASVAGYAVHEARKAEERRRAILSNECQLCGEGLSGRAVRSMKCCGVKFHLDCLRAYMQSLDKCPIKCPCKPCPKIVKLDEMERRAFKEPIPTERIYYCHLCESIITNKKPQVLPCTHRFCIGCIGPCMAGKVTLMGEEPRCPMEACGRLLPDKLNDSIMRMELYDDSSLEIDYQVHQLQCLLS